jgi:tryptophan synthase beta subunit
MENRCIAIAHCAPKSDKDSVIRANLCGRNDEDVFTVAEALEERI